MKKPNKKELSKILKILAIVLILFAVFKGVFVLIILIGLSLGMSYVVNKFNLRSIGIELVTFIGVLAGLKFGPWVALTLSFILILYHLSLGGFFGPYWFWVIPAYSLGGFLSGFFPATDVITLGTYITIGINVNNIFFTAINSPTYLPKYISYPITNVIFNMIIFTAIGRPMFLLMI